MFYIYYINICFIYIYYIKILEVSVTHFILCIFKSIYNFKIKLQINKNFGDTFAVLISHNFKKLITDNTTKAGINYKEQ
jgi:hypothetical protein